MNFDLTSSERNTTWNFLWNELEDYYSKTEKQRTAIYPERKEVVHALDSDFEQPRSTKEAVEYVLKSLSKYAVHTPHPAYYGMFNPRANFPSILADVISAVYNPQLAAWGHAPFAVEVEHMLIQRIGEKFGYTAPNIDGVFATGGQEAHITGLLCALHEKYPDFASSGVQGLEKLPVVYCSSASHHATIKAARVCGLGGSAVKYIEVDDEQRMRVDELERQIKEDLELGLQPFFVFATMGTTGSGAIDPLPEINEIAKQYNLWVHADAAYGGAVRLTKEHTELLDGIENTDSITFDAHKWLSVPMAASLFITKHRYALGKAFSISANFMPEEEDEIDRLSSYTHSIQWSRRFIGLKLYLPLLVFGWEGYEETILHQIRMGDYLREQLLANGWKIYNHSQLPIVCFTDERMEEDAAFSKFVYDRTLEKGNAWIINYPYGKYATLRACITNYNTTEKHIDDLIDWLNENREEYLK
ncbi:aminotransferase class V-fold PLP-dependent enzyme [Aureisphaera galaxeae]|uniref:pyridoxal phosphate-dependent decarboxylase family protein n=1 Tax=Aureisphaera galaxeae TaxID=1538023 RepID=UPI002350E860|nr:aminotransferase class V-fold PLP-dependent enzyme [Aureisphaera galaxeae]MDC8002958.1 aminotransferase class V-fold PLP-dependent enzyme [Aureisphaera galaxeae]